MPDAAVRNAVLTRILDESEAAFEAAAPPSLSLAIGAGGTVVAERAWGLSDVDRHQAATPETAYLLASVTKPMTATAVALLAIEHGVSLHDPISSFLGYKLRQVCSGPEPTLAHLLGHRSGTGRYCRFFYEDDPARPAADFRVTAEDHIVVTTRPGDYYEYSNIGYGVLDEVIAVVSGTSTGEFFQREIFDALNMRSASIGPRYTGTAAAHAERYGTDGTPYPPYDVEHRGASLAWATTARRCAVRARALRGWNLRRLAGDPRSAGAAVERSTSRTLMANRVARRRASAQPFRWHGRCGVADPRLSEPEICCRYRGERVVLAFGAARRVFGDEPSAQRRDG